MRGDRWLLRAGEFLVARAAGRLPASVRDERRREWTAELPVILHDPDIRPALRRAARMLGYALDTIRGTALDAARSRPQGAHPGRHARPAVRPSPGAVLRAAVLAAAALGAPGMLIYLLLTTGLNPGFIALGLLAGGPVRRAVKLDNLESPRDPIDPRNGNPLAIMGSLIVMTANLVLFAARLAHWPAGTLHVLALISDVSDAICLACYGIAISIWLRRARLRRAGRQATGRLA